MKKERDRARSYSIFGVDNQAARNRRFAHNPPAKRPIRAKEAGSGMAAMVKFVVVKSRFPAVAVCNSIKPPEPPMEGA